MARRFNGAIKGPRHRADIVMLFRTGPIEAESQALNAMFFQLRNRFIGQFRRGARSHRNFEPQSVRVIDQFEDVFAAERIAASKDQMGEGIAETEKLLQEALALFRIQFEWIRSGHGFGATMLAGKSAGLSHLPIAKQWIL